MALNLEAVEFLIRAMREIPEHGKFDMREWGYRSSDHCPEEHSYCGTVACAAGWMFLHPDAPKFGLYHEWSRGGSLYFGGSSGPPDSPVVLVANVTGFAARDVDDLFHRSSYNDITPYVDQITPQHVIQKIEQLRDRHLAEERGEDQ